MCAAARRSRAICCTAPNPFSFGFAMVGDFDAM
jgi:hypothetical protein